MARNKPHWRRDKSLERRAGRRSASPAFLVVCEGETEKEYLEALKRAWRINTAQVVVADNNVGSDPGSVVKCALTHYDGFTYDRVFCVFDRDSHATFENARERIRQLASRQRRPVPIAEAISVPCIELWFLLHFGYSTREFPSFNSIRPALAAHIEGYEKADRDIAERLVARIEEAIRNAKRLEREAVEAGFANPFTSFHRLVEQIRYLATPP
jgi:hypothetical protein